MSRRDTQYPSLAPWRIDLLRFAFAVMATGLAVTQWPLLAEIGPSYPFLSGANTCLFTGLGLMALVGVFRPLDMLPVMIFEVVWKLIWLTLVGIPVMLGASAGPAVSRALFDIGLIVAFIPLVPWDYAFKRYFGGRSAAGQNRIKRDKATVVTTSTHR